jgi:precorrin-3B synthase
VHQAADGAMMRVRLPGGQISVHQWRAVTEAVSADGAGTLELTSRGNVQLRGFPDEGAARRFADRLADVGLLPTATHERVRNVLASPLSGRDGHGTVDIRPMVVEFDAALRATPELAALSGRFLFALDDGRGDVAALGADICWVAGTGTLLLAGADHGLRVGATEVTAELIRAARTFLRIRGHRADLWRIADLPEAGRHIASELGGRPEPAPPEAYGHPHPPRLGAHPAGFVVVAAPLGRLSAIQARLIADLATGPDLVITPWRSVVLAAGADVMAPLSGAGLVLNQDSPWLGVTACVGRPGCASALADVQADASASVAASVGTSSPPPGPLPVHWVGCDRCCGRPAAPAVIATATGTGYRVVGPGGEVSDGPLADRLHRARSGR